MDKPAILREYEEARAKAATAWYAKNVGTMLETLQKTVGDLRNAGFTTSLEVRLANGGSPYAMGGLVFEGIALEFFLRSDTLAYGALVLDLIFEGHVLVTIDFGAASPRGVESFAREIRQALYNVRILTEAYGKYSTGK